MDLFDVARSCVRRWYVFLPLLLITAWFSHSLYSSVKPVYYSQAVIGIAPPSTKVANPATGEEVPRNGLLDVGGASLIANMVSTALTDSSAASQVVAAGGLPDYDARMFEGPANMPQLPLILIDATDADPAAVTKTLELVIAQSDASFKSLQTQARVPDSQMVRPFVVSPPKTPKAGMPSRTRSTVAVFVAGAGLSILVTVLADILLSRRKPRRQRASEAETEPAAEYEVPAAEYEVPTADYTVQEDEVVTLNGRHEVLNGQHEDLNGQHEDTSSEPSIRRGANGLPDTLSVSVHDLIAWAQAQSEATGPHAAHSPQHVAEPGHAAPAAEGTTDAR